MNEEDQAYFARKEFDEKVKLQRRELVELRDHGVRVRMRSGTGSVAVNAFGMVTDVRLDRKNTEFIAERTLASYIAEALSAAEKRARTRRDEILAQDMEVV